MTAYPGAGQGSTYECGTQADLSTVSAFGDPSHFRPEGDVTFPGGSTYQSIAQANRGHAHAADSSDKGILIGQSIPDAIAFDYAMRRDVDGTNDPPLVTFLESGGWSCVENSATTVAVYTDEGTWTLTADAIGADAEGQFILVELNDGSYYPVLLFDYASGTKTCKAAMKLPSASQAAKVVQRMYTLTPRTGQVTASKLVSFRERTRGSHTTPPDLANYALACALSKIGDVVIEPNGFLKLPLSFHTLQKYDGTSALAAESFRDGAGQNPVQGCEVGFGTYSASTSINNTKLVIDKATISIPYMTEMMAATGNTSAVVNDNQGYMAKLPDGNVEKRVKVVLEAVMDRDQQTAFEAQTQRYIHFCRPTTSLAVPAWSIVCPNMEPTDFEVVRNGVKYITMRATFLGSSAKWCPTPGDNSEAGNADIFIGMSGEA